MSSPTNRQGTKEDRRLEDEKEFAYEFIKKLVKAWDPDFTKATPEEAEKMEAAEKSGFVEESEIDWDNLQKYAG